ncbi:GNAT family N-acetyltransferase [Candidatus Clostridium stratigraminis]|uniref:GNAT family N-acetyltransferase n=1 Tax=Candidatus Clostridium stratigraminis TaxID=3381661 RepID=A0ABW8T6G8_9CLOT
MDKTLEDNINLDYKENLLEHHIHFLSTHRGIRENLEYGKFIHSDKSDYNIAFPLSIKGIEKISDEYTIYLPQWISMNEQVKSKYKKIGSLTYMALENGKTKWETNKSLIIKRVSSLSDMEDFSIVQGKAFCEEEEEFNEWYPWMREKNIKNLDENTQNFYVAYENGKPIGVTLCIYHENIAGIYAVATLPEHRRNGVSTTLIQRAVDDSISNNIDTIILQTSTESYAHNFYRKLGFKDTFECRILKAS